MMRTKWMRLGVKDPADILRWAGAQSTRQLDEFRYRVIRGREFVSFRMVPRYRVEIGTNDIVVVAFVKPSVGRRVAAAAGFAMRKTLRCVTATVASLRPQAATPLPPRSAALYDFAALRGSALARR